MTGASITAVAVLGQRLGHRVLREVATFLNADAIFSYRRRNSSMAPRFGCAKMGTTRVVQRREPIVSPIITMLMMVVMVVSVPHVMHTVISGGSVALWSNSGVAQPGHDTRKQSHQLPSAHRNQFRISRHEPPQKKPRGAEQIARGAPRNE